MEDILVDKGGSVIISYSLLLLKIYLPSWYNTRL